MKHILSILLLIVIAQWSYSQNCLLRLSGHVEDADTKEKLVGATISLLESDNTIITDKKGDFTFFNLCPGTYTVKVTHVGCDTVYTTVEVKKNIHIDINLPHYHNTNLEEVTVNAIKGIENTGTKQELKGRQLEETRGFSFSEALAKINGIALLQTGATISKPVIHGLHSNRILTINNGVRQEGQQWGNEHAPEIDPYIADNLVVIKGVDELRYGSDAIAGVILVNPKPLRYKPGVYAELNTGYFSNNNAYVVSGMIEQQFKKLPAFSYRLQGTFKQGANVTTPEYRLNNTALRENNFSITTGWRKDNYTIEAFFSQFNTKVGIFSGSHIGNLTDLKNAIAASKPDNIFLGETSYSFKRPYQDVNHSLFKLKTNLISDVGKFNFQFAAQYNQRKEYDVVRNSNTKGPQMSLDVVTLSEDISWEHPDFKNIKGTIGISAMQQNNSYAGRYLIPNYTSSTYGIYWIEKWVKHRWELQGGIRYDYKEINTTRYPYNQPPVTYNFNYSTIGSSFNTIYKISATAKANISMTLASRAPYVNELLSDGIHHGTATYEKGFINSNTIGKPAVKTEKSFNIAAGFSYHNTAKTFSAEVTLYNNSIYNFIYQQPLPDEPVLTIAGAFPQLVYRQTDAVLSGLDIALDYTFTKHLDIASRVAILRAYNRNLHDWLISMPSDRITNTLSYNFNDNHKFSQSYISVEVPVVLKQTRVPDSTIHGKQDYKEPPSGYTLLNLNASTTIHLGGLPLTIGVGARNILNQRYREYLDSFRYFTDATGRNIIIRCKIVLRNLFNKSTSQIKI